jgi:hypothetical protein
MDDWNATEPTAGRVRDPAPNHPRALTAHLTRARPSWMTFIHPVGNGRAAPPFVRALESPTIISAASAGTTFRPNASSTTLRDVTLGYRVEGNDAAL